MPSAVGQQLTAFLLDANRLTNVRQLDASTPTGLLSPGGEQVIQLATGLHQGVIPRR